jgi:hypothetical protein
LCNLLLDTAINTQYPQDTVVENKCCTKLDPGSTLELELIQAHCGRWSGLAFAGTLVLFVHAGCISECICALEAFEAFNLCLQSLDLTQKSLVMGLRTHQPMYLCRKHWMQFPPHAAFYKLNLGAKLYLMLYILNDIHIIMRVRNRHGLAHALLRGRCSGWRETSLGQAMATSR